MTDRESETLAERIQNVPVSTPDGPGFERLNAFRRECESHAADVVGMISEPRVLALLTGIFEHSPYLSQLVTLDVTRLAEFLTETPEQTFKTLSARLAAALPAANSAAEVKRDLRRFKSGVALLTALADLGGVWPVMTVTRVLTEAADAAVAHAVRYLFREAVARGRWDDSSVSPETRSGYFVLAMGKQGAFELNYSSDIDLIVFFDRQKSRLRGGGDLQSFFVRLTRNLVQLLEERTADGYVFRTDLRLRPDAGATQIALSTAAAHGYYETVGQNWERAALIKARVCAGDRLAAEEFLRDLAPFIWRKYLDYAAIADVHAMKRQIHAHKGIGGISVLGQNVKLGRGGIREIEFFVQTQQLIAGGRQPDLRVASTLGALRALEGRGWVKSTVRTDLTSAYEYLRRLEHRLQMIADEQTHEMPVDEAGLERVAKFCGYCAGDKLATELKAVLETVERHYSSLFDGSPELTQAGQDMVLAGATDDPQTMAQLQKLGYSQPSQVLAIVRGWHHGRTPAVRSPRSRELLTEVQPFLIEALASTVDPDAAIAGFDRFLSELPAGVQVFSLLKANPALMRLVADIMGSAPRLARILSKRRRLFDVLLDTQFLDTEITAAAIDDRLGLEFAELRGVRSGQDVMQDILDAARIIGSEQMFSIGARVLAGMVSWQSAASAYSLIAERLVAGLLREVTREFTDAHGEVAQGQAVVLAMGKLGGREMTATSDIDLILVYDFADGAEQSDGSRPLAPSHYYSRLTHRLITALSAQTAEGSLYEVDMRLRPSGQKGPVATKFSSFIAYQAHEAWTWEHMALTRARVIAGSAELGDRLTRAIQGVLRTPRDRVKIGNDVREMRARIEAEKGTRDIWNLKQVRGGLVDLEFIAQFLQLVEAPAKDGVLDPSTLTAIEKLAENGGLDRRDARILIESGELFHALTQILRVSLDQGAAGLNAPMALKQRLVQAAEAASFQELETKLSERLAQVYQIFERLIV